MEKLTVPFKDTQENELLTPRQAAGRLKISYPSIISYIRQGLITAFYVNPNSKRPRYKIRARELDKLLVRVKTAAERKLEDTPPGQDDEPKVKIVDNL